MAPLSAPRDERECPYCAEKILARARLCKHCGQQVQPLAT
jgi:predicted amidophosphoribosyltransferase